MKKRYKYRLPMEEEAVGGMAAVVMAAFSGVFLLISILISFINAGKAGVYLGAFGLSGILLALAGFVIGLLSFREKKKNHRYSTAGSLVSGFLAVFWLALLLVGVSG